MLAKTDSGWRERALLMRSVHMTTADSRTCTRSLSLRSDFDAPPPIFSVGGSASSVLPLVWPIATTTDARVDWNLSEM